MVPAYIISAIVYANLLMLLSIGFTFAYLTAKVPNFAHGAISGIGIYVCFTIVRVFNMNPYVAVPIAFLVCGTISASIYRGVIQILKKYGATLISLSIATVAIEIAILAFTNIYADYLRSVAGQYARVFLLRNKDISIFGLPGVLIISTILTALAVILFHLMLTRTKLGIAMRATVENADLAMIMGVNTELVSLISWFLTGGLAGVAGSLLPLWFQSLPSTGSALMTSVFSASVVGGMSSVYGAMIGGYFIGLVEVLGTIFLMDKVGLWIAPYRPLIPLIIMCFILLKAPHGIIGLIERIYIARFKTPRSIANLFKLIMRGRRLYA